MGFVERNRSPRETGIQKFFSDVSNEEWKDTVNVVRTDVTNVELII